MTVISPHVKSASQRFVHTLKRAVAEDWSTPGLLEPQDLRQLLACIEGRAEWHAQLFPKYCLFADLIARLPSDDLATPQLSFGDCLQSFGHLVRREPVAVWPCHNQPNPQTLAKMKSFSVHFGIDQQRLANREGWEAHAKNAKAFILDVARDSPLRQSVALLGAGRAYDLPLGELSDFYQHIQMVDVSAEAVRETAMKYAAAAFDQGRIETEARDLTGIMSTFDDGLTSVLHNAVDEAQAKGAICAWLSSYQLASPPSLYRLPTADLAVSCLVLSQLHLPYTAHLHALWAARFGRPPESAPIRDALFEFTLRLQQDHVEALCHEKRAVLISDVHETPVTLDANGDLVALAEPRRQLGTLTLRARMPSHVTITHDRQWDWLKVVPRHAGDAGSCVRVHALATLNAGAA